MGHRLMSEMAAPSSVAHRMSDAELIQELRRFKRAHKPKVTAEVMGYSLGVSAQRVTMILNGNQGHSLNDGTKENIENYLKKMNWLLPSGLPKNLGSASLSSTPTLEEPVGSAIMRAVEMNTEVPTLEEMTDQSLKKQLKKFFQVKKESMGKDEYKKFFEDANKAFGGKTKNYILNLIGIDLNRNMRIKTREKVLNYLNMMAWKPIMTDVETILHDKVKKETEKIAGKPGPKYENRETDLELKEKIIAYVREHKIGWAQMAKEIQPEKKHYRIYLRKILGRKKNQALTHESRQRLEAWLASKSTGTNYTAPTSTIPTKDLGLSFLDKAYMVAGVMNIFGIDEARKKKLLDALPFKIV